MWPRATTLCTTTNSIHPYFNITFDHYFPLLMNKTSAFVDLGSTQSIATISKSLEPLFRFVARPFLTHHGKCSIPTIYRDRTITNSSWSVSVQRPHPSTRRSAHQSTLARQALVYNHYCLPSEIKSILSRPFSTNQYIARPTISLSVQSRHYSSMRDDPRFAWAEAFRGMTTNWRMPVKVIIGANLSIWLLWNTFGYTYQGFEVMTKNWTVSSNHVASHPWTLLTSSFSHSHLFHLLCNMLALISLGDALLNILSIPKFMMLYGLSATMSSLAHVTWSRSVEGESQYLEQEHPISPLYDPHSNANAVYGYFQRPDVPYRPALGASGVAYAFLGATAVFWPRTQLRLLFYAAPASTFVMLLTAFDMLNLLFNPNSSLGHAAHLGGLATGTIFAVLIRAVVTRKPVF